MMAIGDPNIIGGKERKANLHSKPIVGDVPYMYNDPSFVPRVMQRLDEAKAVQRPISVS